MTARKKTLNRQEGQSLVQRWKDSDLSRPDFCRSEGVTTRVLGYWIDVFDSDETKTEEPFFILPVEDSPPKIERTPSEHVSSDKQNIPEGVFEAQLGQLTIRVPVSAGQEVFVAMLRNLSSDGGSL